MNKKTTGEIGEEFAVRYLRSQGYKILVRNFRCRLGEIDIIARDGKTVVFVEVKTRRSQRYGSPQEAVTTAKQAKLRAVATYYLQYHGANRPCRFDVLAVNIEGGTVRPELIQNAF